MLFSDSRLSQLNTKLQAELAAANVEKIGMRSELVNVKETVRQARVEFSPEVKSRLEEEIKILNGKLRRRNMEIDNMRTQVSSVQDLHREINQLKREKAKAESEDHAKQLEEEALKTVELLEGNFNYLHWHMTELEKEAKVGKETLENRMKMQRLEQDLSEMTSVSASIFYSHPR